MIIPEEIENHVVVYILYICLSLLAHCVSGKGSGMEKMSHFISKKRILVATWKIRDFFPLAFASRRYFYLPPWHKNSRVYFKGKTSQNVTIFIQAKLEIESRESVSWRDIDPSDHNNDWKYYGIVASDCCCKYRKKIASEHKLKFFI